MKKAVVIGLLALGALYACKKTPLCSYVSTWWNRNTPTVAKLVPRDFEIDRVKGEIQKLDGDVRGLLGPIAEKQALVNRLEREVEAVLANLKDRRDSLLTLTHKVEAGSEFINVAGERLTLPEARAQLARDFSVCKRADKQLQSRKKLLAAQRQILLIAKEQLGKIVELKEQFEVRLTELELREQGLQIEQAVAPLGIDQNQVADIRATLNRIQQSQEEEAIRQELERQYAPRVGTRSPAAPTADLSEIKSFLGGQPAQPKVASGN